MEGKGTVEDLAEPWCCQAVTLEKHHPSLGLGCEGQKQPCSAQQLPSQPSPNHLLAAHLVSGLEEQLHRNPKLIPGGKLTLPWPLFCKQGSPESSIRDGSHLKAQSPHHLTLRSKRQTSSYSRAHQGSCRDKDGETRLDSVDGQESLVALVRHPCSQLPRGYSPNMLSPSGSS